MPNKIHLCYVYSTGKDAIGFDELAKAVESAEALVRNMALETHPGIRFDIISTQIYKSGNGIVAQAELLEK